jgi:L-threonylcarbamoyladenylate synthase
VGKIIRINPEKPEDHLIQEAVAVIRAGGICAYPTETFYGLGVDVSNDKAIKHLFDVKRRDAGNPVAVIVSDELMLSTIVDELSDKAKTLMNIFWPGPLTILFHTNNSISRLLTTNTGKIGIRVSSHPVATALVRELGRPLTTTSANVSGFPASLNLRHIKSYFADKIDLIVDAGELPPSYGSTVVDVTEDKLALIREGVIKGDVIFQYFEEEDIPLMEDT